MSTQPSNRGSGTGAERRQFTRLPIKLDALVAVDGRPPVQCTVRDFCIAGLFVALPPQQVRLVKTETTALLYFALVVDGQQKDYSLSLTVLRVVGGGFGCGFDDADPETMNLLQALASSMNPQALPESPEAVSEMQSGFSWRFAEVQKPLIDLVSGQVDQICRDFVRLVDNALFVAARDAGNNRDETRLTDAQNEARKYGDDIIKNVPEIVSKGVAVLNSPLAKVEGGADSAVASELSLIDKEEFEEFLTVSQLVSDLEPRFKEQLFQLDKRFSLLANRTIDELTNPIGPAVIGGAFSEELKNLKADRIAVNVIYRTLRKVLESNLEKLYAEINEMLVEFGVLPVIEREKSSIKHKPGSSTGSSSPPDLLSSTFGSKSTPPDSFGTVSPSNAPVQNRYGASSGGPRVQAGVPPQFIPQAAPGAVPGGAQARFAAIDPGFAAGGTGQFPPQQPMPAGANVSQVQVPVGQSGAAVHPGTVQAGVMPPGAVQAGVPGAVQAGAVQPGIAAGAPPGGMMPAGFGFEATFGGFGGGGPAVYVPPSLQQAYSAAQAQMALRRELAPASAGGAMPNAGVPTYAPQQVIDGLTHLQNSLANTLQPQMLGVNDMKQRIVDAIVGAGGDPGSIDQRESEAIEVIANLFESLLDDGLLTDSAKSHLARLQGPVHKTALMDQEFFEATHHPVRQLLNRVSILRGGDGEDAVRRDARVAELIGSVAANFNQDMSALTPVLDELDQILKEQRNSFDSNVEEVVSSSEQQEQILSERRGQNLESTDAGRAKNDLSEEWNRWIDRSKLLAVGEQLIMNANTNKPNLVTLVWIGQEFNPFVFVDDNGKKSSSLTLEQVAMYLRRGTLKQLFDEDGGAVDRALFGVVNRMHGEVEAHATHDELTDFMNRKTFLQNIERLLPDSPVSSNGPVLCQIVLDNLKTVNDDHGVEAGDEVLKFVAETIQKKIRGKNVHYGRLGGGELGIFWRKGGVQSAYKKVQACVEGFTGKGVEIEGQQLKPIVFGGITAIEDGMTTPEQLLTIVGDACVVAKSGKDKRIHIVGSENKYREQLEQMVSYIGKALDRERLVLLHQAVNSLGKDDALPAMHVVATAEDRNGKLVPPNFFAQALCNCERAFEIDQWTLKQSFRWMAESADELDHFAAVIIPLSHAAVRHDEISNFIINELMETAVPPGKIFFEISDKDAIANLTEVAELVRTLKEFGCRFVLDEFGSGLGNYDYVKELAVDFVTIQSAYISEATQNPKDFAMAKSINELIHFMGKKTIGKQEPGTNVLEVLGEIGVDFIYDRSKTSRVAA